MPQVGERKTVGGVTGEWDGQTWRQVAAPSTDSVGSFFSDLYHGATEHPLDTLSGFLKGAASGLPTAARIAQAAVPLATGGASIPAQMAIGAGTQMTADLADAYAGNENAPKTFGDFLTSAAKGAAIPAVLGGAGKAYSAIRNGGGAVDTALDVASHLPVVGKFATMAKIARRAAPEAEDAIQSGIGTMPKASPTGKTLYYHAGDELPQYGGPQGRTYSGTSSVAPSASSPRLAGKGPGLSSVLDDALKGLSHEEPLPSVGDTPAVRSVDRGNLVPAAERSGAPAQTGSAPVREPSEAELFNRERNTPYGEGAIMPSSVGPSEFRSPSLDGLNAPQTEPPTDADYFAITGQKHVPEFSVVEPDQSGLFDEQPSDHVVADLVDKLKSRLQDVPAAKATQPELPSSWQQFTSAGTGTRTSAPQIDLPPSLKAIDEMYGPGAQDASGNPFQSTSGKGGNNLLYDPQTPSSYLRDQLSEATDPAERDFLAKSLRQRLRLGTSSLNLGGPQ